MHVGRLKVVPLEPERQPLVLDARAAQDGGVEIVIVDGGLDDCNIPVLREPKGSQTWENLQLTTQAPHEFWMALPPKAWKPRIAYPPLRIVRFSGTALREGVDRHRIEGIDIGVYGVAKTVADCFKYRNKIGLDVALEALRDCWRQKRCTMDELWQAARFCRMVNVMRPYLEGLV